MSETLVQLLYISNSTPETDQQRLDAIISKSRKNNPGRDITGLLIYADGIFIQVLEGERERVHQLFDKICDDVRHSDVDVIGEYSVEERLFSEWSMALIVTSRDELGRIAGTEEMLDRGDVLGLLAEDQTKAATFLKDFAARLT
jgi:hypothetical protein